MLLYGRALRVDAKTTVGEFLVAQLNLLWPIDGVTLDSASVDALADEVWNADVNKHLRANSAEGQRSHVPANDSRTRTLQLLPDEWIYMPVMETRSPEWKLRSITVNTDDVGTACGYIAAWAKENSVWLPPNGPTLADDPTIDPAQLTEYLFNSLLRSGLQAKSAYFYAADQGQSTVDAPPSTPAGGVSVASGRATPDWFLGFWHYIDRIRAASIVHSTQFAAVTELVADGKFVVGTLDVLDRLLTIMERELKPSPAPTGFIDRALEGIGNAYSPDHGMKLDVAAFHAKIAPLRALAKSQLVDQAMFAVADQFKASLKRLTAIEQEPAFTSLYNEFIEDRAKYPATEQAYQIALAEYVQARVLDPQADAVAKTMLDAFLKGVGGASPVTQEIAQVFAGKTVKSYVDDTASVAGLAAGNAPGPSTLWVALTKLGFVAEIQAIQVAPKAPRRGLLVVLGDYLERLSLASGVPKSVLQEWEKNRPKSQNPSAQAKALAARIRAADEVAGRTQSGPGFMRFLGVVNLWDFYSALSSLKSDTTVLDGLSDSVSAASALTNIVADVAQLLVTTDTTGFVVKGAALFNKTIAVADALELLGGIGKWAGHFAAAFGAVYGVVQIAKGISKGDWTKIAGGAGSLLISIGYWANVYVTRRAGLLVVEEGAGEVAAMVVGETVLIGLGSFLTVAGILITVIVLAAGHQDEIMQIAYALFTPGTRKFVDTFLAQLAKSPAVASGPDAVKNAIASAKSAADSASFVTWISMKDSVRAELQGLGLGPEDLKLLMSIPTPVGGPGI